MILSYLVCGVNKSKLQSCRITQKAWIRSGLEAEWSCARSTPSSLAAACFSNAARQNCTSHIRSRHRLHVLDVCGSVHHSTIHVDATVYQNFISYLYEALPDSVQQLHVQQPSTHAKPEAATVVLGSWWWAVCSPKHVGLHINMK